ncbi:ATP-binding cassette domain-containing protein [Cellulomonas fengjieae]|uniref:ABC transporter ATP-binding protein n=1 Tax=Cellulomonas fengjieae TaxID=2819978 RepID=A0ABS3SBK4_9CELL|nr:ABC transporter ATP-binding protein [Cellulomonas fengjieae]MBO3083127.1 ABC transporter ATP-binding protein [Cellulomonas fengjieae]MBO3102126.1 ABC transporter ATP-binding protein [Cellulomonas fengjieae]QVI65508.1 ABC transporter ATP-binding protein [Cellulomonas fengjieae]
MNGFGVEVRDLMARYDTTVALDTVSFALRPGVITGLLGRNGSGKTTALSLMAAFRRPSSGTLLVDGEDPWENERVMAGTCLVRESGDVANDQKLKDTLDFLGDRRPLFSRELADSLLDRFELDPLTRPDRLSRGKRSAFGVVVGLASRTPLTLLDEVHLGMDAPSRYAFYDALLADWVEHPRTIVLSSHLIGEIERLLEDVVVLDRGKVLTVSDAETLRSDGVTVTGSSDAVELFVAGRTVVARQQLGRTAQATVIGALPDDAVRARQAGLELGPVALQDLFVHLTDRPSPAAAHTPEESR